MLGTLFLLFLLGVGLVAGFIYLRFFKFCHSNKLSIGFFHPYCTAGGGGERVLWMAIKAMQQLNHEAFCVVYTGDKVTKAELIKKVKDSFGIEFERPDRIDLVRLHRRAWVEESRYPHFTMLGQSLGSMILAWEAMQKLTPHVMIDTMGYAFTYPLFRWLGGCRVGCYTHYPTISTDMLDKIVTQRPSHNNNQRISQSKTLSLAKQYYYYAFALLYGFMGRFSQVVLVNSQWTRDHIKAIWGGEPHVVYPPCDTSTLSKTIPLNWSKRENVILSIGQFRPEKDHPMQLHILHALLTAHPKLRADTKLVLVGSCRNDADKKRIAGLKDLARQLGLTDNVVIETGISVSQLRRWLAMASVGLHTMWNEHFGIGVVELLAAGVIPVAHNSGGPRSDIVTNNETVGFLASSVDEYAERIANILLKRKEYAEMQQEGRNSVHRFSDERFIEGFTSHMHVLLHNLV